MFELLVIFASWGVVGYVSYRIGRAFNQNGTLEIIDVLDYMIGNDVEYISPKGQFVYPNDILIDASIINEETLNALMELFVLKYTDQGLCGYNYRITANGHYKVYLHYRR